MRFGMEEESEDKIATKHKSFANYMVRTHDLGQEEDAYKLLGKICRLWGFNDLLEYIKWKEEEDGRIVLKIPPLISMLPCVQALDGQSSYGYVGSVKAAEPTYVNLVSRGVQACLPEEPQDSFDEFEFLNDFIDHGVIEDLEQQILGGKGGDSELNGLLHQGQAFDAEGNLMQICLKAIEEFCRTAGSKNVALAMSFQQLQCFIDILGKTDAPRFGTLEDTSFPHLEGIPIAVSSFMPDDKIMLMRLDRILLISGKLRMRREPDKKGFACTHMCNVAAKSPEAVMTVNLAEGCLNDTSADWKEMLFSKSKE